MTRIFILISTLLFSSIVGSVPQIWEASRGEQTFTIMGSVHAGKESFYPLPSLIDERLKNADALIVESDIIKDTKLILPKGAPTRTYLTPKQKKTLENIAREIQISPSLLLKIPPWQTALTIQIALTKRLNLDKKLGIDWYFLSQSHKLNIPVITFETVQEQFNLLTSIDKDGLEFLNDTLTYWTLSKTLLPCIIMAWEQGDGEKLTRIAEAKERENDVDRTFVEDRNHRWITFLADTQKIPDGEYVLVVGALHLYGKEGLLNLLKEEDYQVTLLTQERNADCQLPDFSKSDI